MKADPAVVEAIPAPAQPGNAIVLSVLHLCALASARLLPLDAPPLSLLACPFRAATGLPCLGCGCLHAFAAVAHLDLRAAMLASPLGAIVALGGICLALATVLRLCGIPITLPRLRPARVRVLRIGIGLAVAANWTFVLLRTAA